MPERMEYADTQWKTDEDYSSSKQSEGNVNWIIDKGLWLGKKAVITGAVISSAPLVLPPLVVFSTLGFACSLPFGLVFACYACTQKIMGTLLPASESSSMLDYDEIKDDLMQEVEEQGYEEEEDDVAQKEKDRVYENEYEVERIDLVQEERDRGYEEEGVDLMQEEKDQEDDEAEKVDLVQEVEEQVRGGLNLEVMLEPEVKEEMKDTPAAIERDILEQSVDRWENDVKNQEEEKQIGTRQTVKSTEQGGRNSILPAGAALLQEDVVFGKNGIEKYDKGYLEQEKLILDMLQGVKVKDGLDENTSTSVEIQKQREVEEEETLEELVEGVSETMKLNVEEEKDQVYENEYEVERIVLVQEERDRGYEEEGVDLVQEEKDQEDDEAEEVDLVQEVEEQVRGGLNLEVLLEPEVKEEMKDTPAAIERDIFEQSVDRWENDVKNHEEEKQIGTRLTVKSTEQGGRSSILPAGAALLQEDVVFGKNGIEKYDKGYLEQEKLILDMLQRVKVKDGLDENTSTSVEIQKQREVEEEERLEELVEGVAETMKLNVEEEKDRVNENEYEVERIDLVQEERDRGYEEEGVDLVQEEKDQEDDEAEEVDLVQEVEEQVRGGLNLEVMLEPEVKEEMKDTPAAIERDILEQSVDRWENDVKNQEEEKQIGTRQTVKSTEQGGRNSILPAGAALLQEDVIFGKNGIEKYDKGYLEQEKLILDMLQGVKVKDGLDENTSTSVEIQKQREVEEEERLEELVEGVAETMKLNVEEEKDRVYENEYEVERIDLVQEERDRGYEEEGVDLVQEEKDQEDDEAEKVNLVQEVEEQVRGGLNLEVLLEPEVKEEMKPEVKEEMKDTPAAIERDILEQSVDRWENDVKNQEEEKQIGTRQAVKSTEQGGRNSILPAGAALLQEDVLFGKNGIEKYDKGYLEQEKLILDMLQGVKVKDGLDENTSTSVEIQKQREVEEEERLEELVEGVAETMKLNVDDSIEGRDIFLAGGDDEKYGFVEQSAENEIDEGMWTRNDLNVEAKNETRRGILQAGEEYGQNVGEKHEKKPKELVNDSVQMGCNEDIVKYSLVEDVVPMDGIKVRNEKLIVENENAEPIVQMRKVIVNVMADKKTSEEDKEDVEGKKPEKVVLVAKKVKEESAGDMYINNNEDQVRGTTGLLENIRDESNSALILESRELSDDTDDNRGSTKASVKSFTVIVKTDKEKANASTSVNTKISTKIICRTFEEKVEKEDCVEPKNTLINLNAAGEIADECGLDLFDYTAGDHYSYNDSDISQAQNENIRRKTDDIAEFPVLRVSTKPGESRYLNLLPEADPVSSPNEELLSEEKVREHVDALRAILGYSGPVHSRSIEEIKALYVFTGIEPPTSFDDASDDLRELNEKLRILKSVVGVK